jgi:hypothetical protein
MIKRLTIFLGAILIPIVLAACNAANPQSIAQTKLTAWIDAPLNGSSLPLGPIEIVSHSSDSTGITQVELSVNGAVVRTDQNQDASQHLVVMSQAWTPPSSGNYQLFVRAQNSNGGWSNTAQATVTIIGGPVPTPIPTSVPVSQPRPTPFVPSPTSPARTGCSGVPVIASFYSSTPGIVAGDSVTLIWDAITNADSIEIDNGIGSVGSSGSQLVSPAETTTYTLIARCGDQFATSQVPIRVTQPKPTAGPTDSPIIPSNPTIGAPTYSTNQFWFGLVGCGATNVVVSVPVSDPSGITSVTMFYRYADKASDDKTDFVSMDMPEQGDGTYAATIDAPLRLAYLSAGLRVYFVATSASGGSTTSPVDKDTVTLSHCSKA